MYPRWGKTRPDPPCAVSPYAEGVAQHSPGSPQAHPGYDDPDPIPYAKGVAQHRAVFCIPVGEKTTRPARRRSSYAEGVAQHSPGSPQSAPWVRRSRPNSLRQRRCTTSGCVVYPRWGKDDQTRPAGLPTPKALHNIAQGRRRRTLGTTIPTQFPTPKALHNIARGRRRRTLGTNGNPETTPRSPGRRPIMPAGRAG